MRKITASAIPVVAATVALAAPHSDGSPLASATPDPCFGESGPDLAKCLHDQGGDPDKFINTLKNGNAHYGSDEHALEMARAACFALRDGESLQSVIVNMHAIDDVSVADAQFITITAIADFCPAEKTAIQRVVEQP